MRQVTNVFGEAIAPDWSPDGSEIAFEHGFEAACEGHAQIMLMNADGSDVRHLTTAGLKGSPAFTPDGRHLVYECVCNPDGIHIMRTDGTNRHRLSPDGRSVTFVRHKVDGELQALFAVNIDETHQRKLVPYFREAPSSMIGPLTVAAS